MGGGNGQKSQTKRLRNMAKLQKDAKAKAGPKSNPAEKIFLKCQKCMQVFNNTVQRPELLSHCENKHADCGFEQSFPDYEKFRSELLALKGQQPAKAKK